MPRTTSRRMHLARRRREPETVWPPPARFSMARYRGGRRQAASRRSSAVDGEQNRPVHPGRMRRKSTCERDPGRPRSSMPDRRLCEHRARPPRVHLSPAIRRDGASAAPLVVDLDRQRSAPDRRVRRGRAGLGLGRLPPEDHPSSGSHPGVLGPVRLLEVVDGRDMNISCSRRPLAERRMGPRATSIRSYVRPHPHPR